MNELIERKILRIYVVVQTTISNIKDSLTNDRGEGFVDSAIKILIAVVIGAVLLGSLFLLMNNEVMPKVSEKVMGFFNFGSH